MWLFKTYMCVVSVCVCVCVVFGRKHSEPGGSGHWEKIFFTLYPGELFKGFYHKF